VGKQVWVLVDYRPEGRGWCEVMGPKSCLLSDHQNHVDGVKVAATGRIVSGGVGERGCGVEAVGKRVRVLVDYYPEGRGWWEV